MFLQCPLGPPSTKNLGASSTNHHNTPAGTEAVWGASPIPAAQRVALFARLAQEFSWADYGISISVGFL